MPIQIQTLQLRVGTPAGGVADRALRFSDRLVRKRIDVLRSARDDALDMTLAPDLGGLEDLLRQSPGQALPAMVRGLMEGLLGAELGGVRVHTDPAAEQAADMLGAEAFALGQDIYFGEGYYDAGSARGVALIGHELTHVAQGLEGAPTLDPSLPMLTAGPRLVGSSEAALEQQAHANERFIASQLAGGGLSGVSLHHAQELVAGPGVLGAWDHPPGAGSHYLGTHPVGGAIRAWTPGLGGAGHHPALKARTAGARLRRIGSGYPGALALKAEAAGQQAVGELDAPPPPNDPVLQEALQAFRGAAPYLGAGADIAIGFVPIVGDVYDVLCGLMGRAIFTWDHLDVLDRLLCFVGVIPIPFISGAIMRRGKRAIHWAARALKLDLPRILRHTMGRALHWIKRIWGRAKTLLRRLIRPVVRETDPASLYRASPLTRGMMRALYGGEIWQKISVLSHSVDDMVRRFLPGAQFEFRPVSMADAPGLWTTAARTGAPRAFNATGTPALVVGTLAGVPVERVAFQDGRVTRIVATTHSATNPLSLMTGAANRVEGTLHASRGAANAALHELGHAVQFTALGAALERGILNSTDEFWDVYMSRARGESALLRAVDYPFARRMEAAAQLGVEEGAGTALTGRLGHLLDEMVKQVRERLADPTRAQAFAELVEEMKAALPGELLYKKRFGALDGLEDDLLRRLDGGLLLDLLEDSERLDGKQPTRRPEPGFPLEYSVRNRLEAVIGADLSDVRIHTGLRSAQLADAVEAEAFTLGRHIFMGDGSLDTTSPEGLGLLVHEATHVAQDQRGQLDAGLSPGRVMELEREAYGREAAFVAQARAQTLGPPMTMRHEPGPPLPAPAQPAPPPAAEPEPRLIELQPAAAEFPALRKDRRVTLDPVQEVIDLYHIPLGREEFLQDCKDRLLDLMREEIELENERRETLAWNPHLPQA